jgi:ornithine cyclodeaminase/alanine dehydrogenase-like protein (mu-crystallin family)
MVMNSMTSTLLLTRSDLYSAWSDDVRGVIDAVEHAFRAYISGEVILPDKASQVFDETVQDRINCMPSTVKSLGFAGVKWVSVFPENPSLRGLRNVGGCDGTLQYHGWQHGSGDGCVLTNLYSHRSC